MTYVQDAWTLLDSRRVSRVVIIGTSLGAVMGMVMAAARPARICGVVLNDAGPEFNPVGLQRIAAYAGKLPPVSTWQEAAAQTKTVYGSSYPDSRTRSRSRMRTAAIGKIPRESRFQMPTLELPRRSTSPAALRLRTFGRSMPRSVYRCW